MDQSTIGIIITGLAIVSFVLEKIPLAMTAMIAALAMGMTGCIELKSVYASFGSTTTMMVAGMMVVGDALFQNGVASKIGNALIKSPFAKSERALIFVTVIISSFISAFLSNSGTIAMLMPLLGALAMASKGKLRYKMLIMPAGFGCAVGGAGTLVGSTAQLIAQGILVETKGCVPMTFFQLSRAVAPMCIIMAIWFATFGYNIMEKVLGPSMNDTPITSGNTAELDDKPLTWKGWLSVIVMLGCVGGFLKGWNVGMIGLTGATILITTRCMDLKKTFRELDWNTLIILSAAMAFAKGLNDSGGGKVIAEFILNLCGGTSASAIFLLCVGIFLSCVLSNFMSNTAVSGMLSPIFIQLAMALGVNPTTFVIGVVIGASTVVSTPVGTPCVTQTLPAGYKYMDYVKIGLPINIILAFAACGLCILCYGL